MAQPGVMVTIGAEYGSFLVTVGGTIGDSRRRQRVYRVSTIGGETALSRATSRHIEMFTDRDAKEVSHKEHYV